MSLCGSRKGRMPENETRKEMNIGLKRIDLGRERIQCRM